MELNIFGYSLYELLLWFWIYSFLGWSFECIYAAIHEGRLINRGFVHSPFCIIYGFGALSIILLLSPIKSNIFLLFIVGVIVTSILEFLVYVLLDKIFHQRWWDYSDLKYNFKGILSLESSLAWGVLSVLLLKLLQPFIVYLLTFLPKWLGIDIILVVTIIYVVDFIISSTIAMKRSGSSKMTILKVKTVTLRKILVKFFRRK